MEHPLYPAASRELVQKLKELAPDTYASFQSFSQRIFADGALPAKTKELIAVAVAHVTQCPYCIRIHTKRAKRSGASGQEIMEAIWVAAEMRAGAAVSHAALALDTLSEEESKAGA